MIYARINLEKTNYTTFQSNWEFIRDPDINVLNNIYTQYCRYKQFSSVMPIFDREYQDPWNDVIGYFDQDELVAFSIIRKYDHNNVEAVQFAWTYHDPKQSLGIESLKHECALYKKLGYQYLYLGGADEYKSRIDGFEILGAI
jgi:arginyl-tRNA--protein-N-Asp/Glu arginylyltransferase